MQVMRKVPEITIYFWILKLLTTAMGDQRLDYLVYAHQPIYRGSSWRHWPDCLAGTTAFGTCYVAWIYC